MPTYDPIIEWSAYELARRKREASTFEDRIEVERCLLYTSDAADE